MHLGHVVVIAVVPEQGYDGNAPMAREVRGQPTGLKPLVEAVEGASAQAWLLAGHNAKSALLGQDGQGSPGPPGQFVELVPLAQRLGQKPPLTRIVAIRRSGQILETARDGDAVQAARREGLAGCLVQAEQVGGQVFEA